VVPAVTPGCEWVLLGEGVPTRKWDGTACLIRGGRLFKRYDCKRGRKPPEGFEPCEPEPDAQTGHWPGWVPVGEGPEDRYFREALQNLECECSLDELPIEATYELCGPKINGNPEGFSSHVLIPHGRWVLPDFPRTYECIRQFLETPLVICGVEWFIEGIVWWHPDGRKAKVKRRDFGLPWPFRKDQSGYG